MSFLKTLLLVFVTVTCVGQTGYYRDSSNRAYYLDSNNERHYIYNASVDRYGYSYYINQYGQRHYLYNGNIIGIHEYETRRADFDVGRVGGLGRPETETIFKSIWAEFRKNFVMTEKGSFEESSSANTPDNEQTRSAFLRYVSEYKPEVTVPFIDKCSRCDARGYKTGLVENGYYGGGSRLQTTGQVICDACNGTGGARGVVIYRLSYSAAGVIQPTKLSDNRFSTTQALAEQGDIAAQFSLGEYYWQGNGKTQDPLAIEAIKWFGLSLLGGNSEAANKLIQIYATPNTVRKNDLAFARALHYAFKSNNLNESDSASWVRISSRLEDIEARTLAARMVQLRSAEKLTQGQCIDPKFVRASLSEEYPSILARSKTNDPLALYQLGLRYATGLGGASRNDKVALIWLEQAACKGNADAFYVLAAFYEDGTAYPRNPTAAHALYLVATKLLCRDWSASERTMALSPWINLQASEKASLSLLERYRSGKLTVDDIQKLVSLPPKQDKPPTSAESGTEITSTGATGTAKQNDDSPSETQLGVISNLGSGLLFTRDGHMFTTEKNIRGAKAIYVVRYENGVLIEKLEAKVLKIDVPGNLAILQCAEWKPAASAPTEPPPIVPSKYCRLGDTVFAIGYAQTRSSKSVANTIQGEVRSLNGTREDMNKLQHSILVQAGYAGGPVCLTDGRIIGMAGNPADTQVDPSQGGQDLQTSLKADYLLALAKSAFIEVPATLIDGPAMEHVKAYTVQIYCDR